MKKIYLTPEISIQTLSVTDVLLSASIQVDSENKVEEETEIGFVKEDTNIRNIWDDDWSQKAESK
ncbi:MAG: hypothetical protein K6F94_09085 [Bacteroidaceae bacterium]|nr:hypothetical protein [Bacteroidaceae bacterium]